MKRALFTLLALLCLVQMLLAAPLTDMPVSFTQPDGSQIEIFASGDEFHNWLHDASGFTIVRNEETGYYSYALPDGEKVKASDIIVGRDNPASRNLEPGINLSQRLIAEKYDRYHNTVRDYSNGRSPHTGQFNNLVVFIKFTGDPDFTSPITYYQDMFNADATDANSMKNYFWQASYQQLTVDSFYYPIPDGTTIVTYIDPQPRNYYRPVSTTNPIGYDPDDEYDRTIREQTMLANCIDAISDQIPTSLVIDGDNDGYVDNVCFIVQGQPDGWAELLWPHRWVLYYAEAYIHGARVWDFNLQLESFLFSSGASVLAHEMFHSLSAPDLYRYYDSTITPIGGWDLMAGNSNPPQHMSVWMKYRYGEWVQNVPMITQSGEYTLYPVASHATNNIYRISSWRTNESYVLEYRKGAGLYDHNLPGSGLLVYRLDTRESGNASGPPDELYLYRPHGTNPTTNGVLSSAHFSRNAQRTLINESTVPNGFLGNGTSGGLNLYNIGYAGDSITFSVKVSDIQITYPIGGETWFTGSNKNITWKARTSSGNIKIEYSTDDQASWTVLVASTPNDGSYIWNSIPYLTSTQCFIRLTLLSNSHTDVCIAPFSIIAEVNPPDAIFPPDNAVGMPTNPVLSWTSVFGATSYQVQLSAFEYFDSFIVNTLEHPDTTYTCPNLIPFTQYYWRIASISDIGYSMFTDTQTFTTGQISVVPNSPTLVSPTNFATNLPRNPLLSWTASNLAESYQVQLAYDSFFSTGLLVYDQINALELRVPLLEESTQYYWRVRAYNPAGYGNFSSIRRFTTGTSVGVEEILQPEFRNRLVQNYPNPFNPSTTIAFELKTGGQPATLKIYNSKGQLVRTLLEGSPKAGMHSIHWNGRDDNGSQVGSGIYLYRLQTGDFSSTRKMLLME